MGYFDFNVIFNFKNLYSPPASDWFWKILPALISAIVTVLVFLAGQALTKRTEREKERKRIREVREYFYVSFLKFKIAVSMQIDSFNNIIYQLKEDEINSVSIFRSIVFSYDCLPSQLLSISRNDTYKFFIQDKEDNKRIRIRNHSNFYSVLSLLGKIITLMEESNLDSVNKYTEAQNKIEENKDKLIDMLLKIHHRSFTEGKQGVITDNYYLEMGKFYENYMKNVNGSIDPVMHHLIYPIQNISITKYLSHPDSKEILSICKIAEYYYKKIFEDKRVDLGNFEHWHKHFSTMKEIISNMTEIEFKDFNFGEEIFLEKMEVKNRKQDAKKH